MYKEKGEDEGEKKGIFLCPVYFYSTYLFYILMIEKRWSQYITFFTSVAMSMSMSMFKWKRKRRKKRERKSNMEVWKKAADPKKIQKKKSKTKLSFNVIHPFVSCNNCVFDNMSLKSEYRKERKKTMNLEMRREMKDILLIRREGMLYFLHILVRSNSTDCKK